LNPLSPPITLERVHGDKKTCFEKAKKILRFLFMNLEGLFHGGWGIGCSTSFEGFRFKHWTASITFFEILNRHAIKYTVKFSAFGGYFTFKGPASAQGLASVCKTL
jgi:hypothetical protein